MDKTTPLDQQLPTDFMNGKKCELFGVKVEDMSRDELVTFVGFLDTALTQLQIAAPACARITKSSFKGK